MGERTMNIKEYYKLKNIKLPQNTDIDIIDLVRLLYEYNNVPYKLNNKTEMLKKHIKNKKHIFLILIDGMGCNLINSLSDNSILKNNKIMDIKTVNPTSTGCVLTSIMTAEYPIQHGILGYNSYNREYNLSYLPLLLKNRITNNSLLDENIPLEKVFKYNSKLKELKRNVQAFFPQEIVNSNYSKWCSNNRYGYKNFNDIVNKYQEIISSDNETFTYIYYDKIDETSHDYGVYSKEVNIKIQEIEKFVNKLSLLKNDDVEIIITADHGQNNVSWDIIIDMEKYKSIFYSLPSIDFNMASYYVKEDKKNEFEKMFKEDFEDKMYLFKTEEFIDSNIFGFDNISEYMKSSLGEYISVCNDGYCFINSLDIDKYLGTTKGNHAGLSDDETKIPLIII